MPIIANHEHASSKVQLLLFSVAAVGILITSGGGLLAYRSWQARSWPTVEGQITKSSVEREKAIGDTDEDVQFWALVNYKFVVDGKDYVGDRVAFGIGTSNRRSDARSIVDRYPVGRTVEVHYKPGRPNDAVLETRIGGFAIIALIVGAIIVLTGLVGFIAEFRGKVSAILAQASNEDISGDEGTYVDFDS